MKFTVAFFVCVLFISSVSTKKADNLKRMCYYAQGDPIPSKLNVTLCTHILAGFCSVKNGSLDLGTNENKKRYLQTTKLKRLYPDLKVMLSVGGGGDDMEISWAVNCLENRTKFIATVFYTLKKYNFDGFDVDWEFPVWNDGRTQDKKNFIYFLQEFKQASRKLKNASPLLTVAVGAPQGIVEKAYDIPQMAKYVDFINLMSYDFHDYFWYTPATGHNSPLFNRSTEHAYFATLNTAWTAEYWYTQGMPKPKIMVGIPTYGHTYKLLDPQLHGVDAPATGVGYEGDDVTFYFVCQFLSNGGTRVFDDQSQVPYAYRDYNWISYEDATSATIKAKWIKSEGYGGAMTFDLNCDDWQGICGSETRFPIHQAIYDVFVK